MFMYTGYHSVMFPGKEFVQKNKNKKKHTKKKVGVGGGWVGVALSSTWTINSMGDLACGP